MGEADDPAAIIRAVADSLAVGFAIADAVEWRVEYANLAFEKWFPRPPGDDLLVERLTGLDVERARKRIAKGRKYDFDTELRSAARTTVLRTSLREIDNGGRHVLIAETLNVSKHKEVEHMLDSFAKLADRNKVQLENVNQDLKHKTEELEVAYDQIKAQKDRADSEP